MWIRLVLCALLIAGTPAPSAGGPVPSPSASAAAPAASGPIRETLELAKLQAEIVKLRAETVAVSPWYAAPLLSVGAVLVGFLGVLVTGLLGLRTAFSTRLHVFDTRLFEARLESYGALLAPTRAFALHFPERFVDRSVCAQIGHELRKEYFGLAGTLMTVQARRRYMTLQLMLTRAARCDALRVPRSDDDYVDGIDEQKVDRYRALLGLTQADADLLDEAVAESEMAACRAHAFGGGLPADIEASDELAAARRFQDFVVQQFAASRLRTELGRDVSARRPIVELRPRRAGWAR